MKIEDLKYETKLEVLLLIEQNNISGAVSIVHLELKCGLRVAKEIIDSLRKEFK